MKRSLLIGLTLALTATLAACGNKEAPETGLIENDLDVIQSALPTEMSEENAGENTLVLDNVITMNCPEAVQAYLESASLEGEGDATVQSNDAVTVDYVGRLADGSVFDTSVESVAKGCGLYVAGRNYDQGLPFTAGAGQMIQGFDNAVLGMKVNQTKTVTIPAAEAYGEVNPDYIQTLAIEGSDWSGFVEGEQVITHQGVPGTITKITDTEVTLDYNHHLAGKDLIFDITVKSIN